NIELATADVNPAFGRLAKRNDAGIEPVYQRTQRKKIKLSVFTNLQTITHTFSIPPKSNLAVPHFTHRCKAGNLAITHPGNASHPQLPGRGSTRCRGKT